MTRSPWGQFNQNSSSFIVNNCYVHAIVCDCRDIWIAKARSANIYAIPDIGAGKGIPHEPLSDAKKTDRNGSCALPNRETNKNLVPESTNENEKGDLVEKVVLFPVLFKNAYIGCSDFDHDATDTIYNYITGRANT